MKVKQKYIHLLLKNSEEREKSDKKEVLKLLFKHLKKVDDRMYCSAYTMNT